MNQEESEQNEVGGMKKGASDEGWEGVYSFTSSIQGAS